MTILPFNKGPQGSNHLLRMVMEPKYHAFSEVIGLPNHHLTFGEPGSLGTYVIPESFFSRLAA